MDQQLFLSAKGAQLFPIFCVSTWLGFTPEVLRRVEGAGSLLEETDELGVKRKESMLAFDCSILLCSIYPLCLSLSCIASSLLIRNFTLLRSSLISSSYYSLISPQAFSHFSLHCFTDQPRLIRCVRVLSSSLVRLLASSYLILRVSFSFLISPTQQFSISFAISAQLQSFFSRPSFSFINLFSRS